MTTGPSSETASAREAGLPPVGWREIVAVLALVVLCDITLYRSYGPAGHAALTVLAPFLFWLGSPRPRCRASLWVLSLMLAVLAAKLVWCGYLLLLPVGAALLVAWALSLSGQVPHVLETVVFGSQTVLAGCHGLIEQGRFLIRAVPRSTRTQGLNVVLPLVTAVMFSLLFVLANPDLLTTFSARIAELFDQLRDWLIRFSPQPLEVLFWLAVLWIGVGLLRPRPDRPLLAEIVGDPRHAAVGQGPLRAALYPAFRNTLMVVIALFAVYCCCSPCWSAATRRFVRASAQCWPSGTNKPSSRPCCGSSKAGRHTRSPTSCYSINCVRPAASGRDTRIGTSGRKC